MAPLLTFLLTLVLTLRCNALEVTPLIAPPETRIQRFEPGLPRSFKPEWKGDVREFPGAEGSLAVIFPRGEGSVPGAGGTLQVDKPVWVYLSVFQRGQATLTGWEPTGLHLTWVNGSNDLVVDRIVKRRFPAGAVEIPPHDGTNGTGYGVPHLVLIREEPISEPPNPKTPDELRAAWLKGETLNNGALEARVIGHPYLRLTGLRRPGERDWLRPYGPPTDWGLRTWLMTPEGQTAASTSICQQPARIERTGKLKLSAQAETDPKSGLALRWEVEMDAKLPVLRITHIIRNDTAQPQTIAPWAIAVVNRDDNTRTMAAADDATPGSLPKTYFMSGKNAEAQRLAERVIIAAGQIGMRLTKAPADELKLGSISRAGWTLFERDNGAQLISWSPFPEGTIPDGGRNLTLYDGLQAETEHVGALSTLAPGEEASLLQELTFRDGAK